MALGPLDGVLNVDLTSLPQIDVGDYMPDVIRQPKREPLTPNQPRAIGSLQTKYSPGGLYDQLTSSGNYSPQSLAALRSYDEDRAQRGQAPLTEQQTLRALAAATERTQVTPEPERSMFNLPKNLIGDLGEILRSIPQLPGALVNELSSAGDIGKSMAEAPNPIAGLANAPIVRMLPGAFIAGNIAGGTPGELARHPLYTFLDLLPGAQAAAKATGTFGRVAELADIARTTDSPLTRPLMEAQRLERRPLTAALTRTVDEEGNLVRNTAGEMALAIRNSKAGRKYQEWFGRESRDAMFVVNGALQRVRGIMNGEIVVPDDALSSLARDAVEFDKRITDMGVDTIELFDRMTQGNYNNATPQMLEAMEATREFNQQVSTMLQDRQLAVMFDKELYDLPTGLRLKSQERQVARAEELADLRGRVEMSALDPTMDARTSVQRMLDAFNRPRMQGRYADTADQTRLARLNDISKSELTTYHNAMVQQLDNLGYDTTMLREGWQFVEGRAQKYRNGKPVGKAYTKNPEQYAARLRQVLDNPDILPRKNIATLDEAIDFLKGKTRDKRMGQGAKLILAGIKDNNGKMITMGLEHLRRTDAWANDAVINRIKAIRDTDRLIQTSRLKGATQESVAKARKNMAQVSNEAVPARFIPEVERQTALRARDQALEINTVDQAEMITKLADDGLWTDIPNFTPDMYRTIQREAAREWKRWRDEGFDPIYVHTVTPNRVFSALQPKAGIVPNSISSVKRRSLDMAPGVKNVALAMTDQMRELLSREHVELAVKQIMDQMGETEISLHRRFADAARNRAASNPAVDFKGHLQQLINEQYTLFNPMEAGYTWGSPYLKKLAGDRMYIPRHVATNLKGLAEPKRLLGGLLDPITNTFRAAATSLSIRTQLYNVVGNMVATELSRPGATLRSLEQVRAWQRDPTLIPEPLKKVIGSAKNTFLDLDREAMGVVNSGTWGYLRGRTLGRLWDAEQAAKTPGKPITRYGEKFRGLVEKSYTLNGKVDDFYRMVNYIDAYDAAVKKGSSVADAERKAIVAVRENLQDWMSMTPMERSVIRSVFPFYGYMGHAMRFVLRYPFDHPIRTEMMAKLAEAELEDQDYLPSRFMSMLFVGGVGPQGEQGALNLGPFNPFGEVANFMTLRGMLGATNPVIQTMLQMSGIDGGEAELYPSLRYDPVTGRMTTASTNPLTNLLHNTIPQSTLLTALLGVNSEFNDMARRDPAAANRYLASGLTIPMLWREIQVDQEIMKAELARMDAESKIKNEALRTGNWQEALQFPSLREYLRALEQMPQDQLQAFRQLTPEQIESITGSRTNALDIPPLPQMQGVTPLDDQITQLLQSSNPLVVGAATGRVVPGASLANRTGGT